MRAPPILILSRSEAAMLLRQPDTRPPSAILSIRGPHEPPLDPPHAVRNHLELVFDDADVPEAGNELAMLEAWARQRWSAEVGRPLVPPCVEDVRRIVAFAGEVREAAGPVLFQCQAGISRSPAAALACLACWAGPGEEHACVRAMAAVRPAAVPHAGLVRMADAVLGRGGELVRATRAASS